MGIGPMGPMGPMYIMSQSIPLYQPFMAKSKLQGFLCLPTYLYTSAWADAGMQQQMAQVARRNPQRYASLQALPLFAPVCPTIPPESW